MFFSRVAELSVGDTKISGLDISFFVEKTLTAEPNTAEIKIWNLNSVNRKTLQDQKHIPLLLKAGYQNSVGLFFYSSYLKICDFFPLRKNEKSLILADACPTVEAEKLLSH